MLQKLGYEVTSYTNLCTDGMNSYGAVQLFFCHPTFNSSCKPLGDFSSIWAKDMETNDFLLNNKDNETQARSHIQFPLDNV